jgi:hypothetical protein
LRYNAGLILNWLGYARHGTNLYDVTKAVVAKGDHYLIRKGATRNNQIFFDAIDEQGQCGPLVMILFTKSVFWKWWIKSSVSVCGPEVRHVLAIDRPHEMSKQSARG